MSENTTDRAYLAAREKARRKEIDEFMAVNAPPAAPAPAKSGEKIGLARETARGLGRGAAGIGSAIGAGVEVAGIITHSDKLKAAGEQVAAHWASLAAQIPKSEAAEGDVWEDGNWHNAHWLTASVAESVPSLAAALIPAAGAAKLVQVGGKAMRWSPALALKLARIGAAVTGGTVGGTMEGASTFETVKRRGGSDDDAVKAYALMSLASAGLNAIQIGKMLKPVPGTAGKIIRKGAQSGGWEALTEWLESPAEAVILGDDVIQAMKDGLNVVPASLVTGALGGGAVGLSGKMSEGAVGKAKEGVAASTGAAPSAPADAAPTGTVQGGPDLTQAPEGAPTVSGLVPGRDIGAEHSDKFMSIDDAYQALSDDPKTELAVEDVWEEMQGVSDRGRSRGAMHGGDTPDDTPENINRLVDETLTKIGAVPLTDTSDQGKPNQDITNFVEGMAGQEIRVNTKYVGGDQAFKDGIANLNRYNAESLAADRKTVSHDETVAASSAVFKDANEAVTFNPETDRVDKDVVTALRDYRDRAKTLADEAKAKFKAGDVAAGGEFKAMWLIAARIESNREKASRVLARGLESHKIESDAMRPTFDASAMSEVFDTVNAMDDVPAEMLMEMDDRLVTKEQKETFKRTFWDAVKGGKVEDALHEAWIHGLISSFKTWVTQNPMSNAIMASRAVGERAIAENLPNSKVARGESLSMVQALIESWGDAWKVHNATWRTGVEASGVTKLEHEPAITAENFNLDPQTGIGKAVDLFGKAIRFQSRGLIAGDAFAKFMSRSMQVKALSLRQATLEADGNKMTEQKRDDFIAKKRAEIEADPGNRISRAADEFALFQTFQNEIGPGGKIIRDLSGHRVGRWVIPFSRTPMNLVNRGIEGVAGLQFASSDFRRDLASKGPNRDLAVAKIVSASLTTTMLGALASRGVITGAGPRDPELRKQKHDMTGWQPYSVKVGDKYYSYSRLDPLGMQFGMIADFVEVSGHLPEWRAAELGMAIVYSMSQNITSKTWALGLSNALEAITRPDSRGQAYAAGLARSTVPGWIRAIEQTGDATIRETRTLLDEVRAGIPGWSESLPPSRNIFGEKIEISGGWGPDLISAIYTSTDKHDPAGDEISRLGLNLSMPPKVIFGRTPPDLRMDPESAKEGIELTPTEYDQFVRFAGDGLREDLEELVAAPYYQGAGDGRRELMIRSAVNAHREAGKAKLLSEAPGLFDAVQDRVRERQEELTSNEVRIAR